MDDHRLLRICPPVGGLSTESTARRHTCAWA